MLIGIKRASKKPYSALLKSRQVVSVAGKKTTAHTNN